MESQQTKSVVTELASTTESTHAVEESQQASGVAPNPAQEHLPTSTTEHSGGSLPQTPHHTSAVTPISSISMPKPLYDCTPKIFANVFLSIAIEREPYGKIEIEVLGKLLTI